jgi:multiple sugar transport system permease protein
MTGGTITSMTGEMTWMASIKRNRRWALVLAYISLGVFAVFFLFPPYYMLITSLKHDAEITCLECIPWIIQQGITFTHYLNLFQNTFFPTYFINSAIVAVCSVSITMVISTLAAYSLARMRFWGSTVLAAGVFLTYLVPETLLFIPMFKVVNFFNLINTKWSLVLVYPTIAVPFCTWIMIGYFGSIPKELDEAALVDGASHMKMLTQIFIPVALPGIIAATIFAFTVSWAQFLYPLAFPGLHLLQCGAGAHFRHRHDLDRG